MDALTALHTRTSVNLLCDPAPNAKQRENLFKAALRACDHRSLKPWRFITIEGDARRDFGVLMADVKAAMDGGQISWELRAKLEAKPFRAPLIVVVVATIMEHEKVPEIEQVLAAGASAQMMMTAAHAQGVGAIWRSGSMMFRPEMRAGLGLLESDQIVGFIYLGTPKVQKPAATVDPSIFVSSWPSK